MRRIFIPTTSVSDWVNLLADPKKQWQTGFSACTMAHAWEAANGGFPAEIGRLFDNAVDGRACNLEMLLAIPEWKVHLPPKGHPSQNDLFVLARGKHGLVTIMVEGKVAETFGETLEGWLKHPTPGKLQRLSFIQSKLGLPGELPKSIRYQLLHRAVSALLEAEHFNASCAVVLVHSFHQECLWFEDFQAFLSLFGVDFAQPGKLYLLSESVEVPLFAGWVTGNPMFLQA
jgi:hypothetical protein